MRDFTKQSFLTFLTQAASFILGFFSLIIISRVLGPEGRGIYSLIILIPGMIMTFGNLGLGSGNVYFIGSKKYKTEDVLANSLLFSIVLGLLLILVFWGLLQIDFFQKLIQNNKIPQLYLWLVVVTIPLTLLLGFFQSVLMGQGNISSYNKISLLREIFQLFLIVILLWILKTGILGAVLSHVLAVILAVLISLFFLKKISKIRLGFHKGFFKDSFSYGLKVYLTNVVSFLNYRLDMFLIAFFLNPIAVGLYSVAVAITERLFIIPGAFTTVLYPKISSIEDHQANEFTSKVARQTFFIMIIASILLMIFAAPFIRIFFGPSFLPSILPLFILLPAIIAFGIGGVLAADLAGRGKPEFAFWGSLIGLIVNVVLNILFIPKWGISGAAFASTISYWVDTLILISAFLVISRKSLRDVLLIKKGDFQDYQQLFSRLKLSAYKK